MCGGGFVAGTHHLIELFVNDTEILDAVGAAGKEHKTLARIKLNQEEIFKLFSYFKIYRRKALGIGKTLGKLRKFVWSYTRCIELNQEIFGVNLR